MVSIVWYNVYIYIYIHIIYTYIYIYIYICTYLYLQYFCHEQKTTSANTAATGPVEICQGGIACHSQQPASFLAGQVEVLGFWANFKVQGLGFLKGLRDQGFRFIGFRV